MAHGLLSALRGWAQTPVWARIALIYVTARVVTTGLFLLAAAASSPVSRFGADASLADFVLGWDAQWYWLIAVEGYPTELPLTESGEVAENAWAFMPVFAYAARLIGAPLGSWGAGALVLALVAGYLACLVLHRLLHPLIGSASAMQAVALLSFGPLAALFQVGYAEGLFLLFLLLSLDAVARRRYALLYMLVPVMAFTRPGVLAFALYLGLHGILRLVRRRSEPLPASHVIHIVALGTIAVATGFGWQIIVGVVTGDPGAYLATELAWRRNWLPGGVDGFIPFEGWVQAAQLWFTLWGLPAWAGLVALVVLVIGMAWALLASRTVRRLGPELRLWSASYLLYLLAVFFPQSSTFRLLLPIAPLAAGALAVPRSHTWRAAVLVCCVLAQWVWIHNMYALGNTYWRVP